MGIFFRRHYINSALLFSTLTAFTVTYTLPLPAAINLPFGLNEAAFFVRLEKLVEKLVKSKSKEIDKMIGYFVDIKNEIETSYDIRLNIDDFIGQIKHDLSKKRVKYDKRQFEAIEKKIKSKDKKRKNHANYVANTMYLEGYEMNALDEAFMFIAKHGKDKDSEKDEQEIVLPSLLVYGVTCALCGMFLMILPIPACKDWGSKMVVAGVTACANSLCAQNDKNREKEKEKK